MKTIDILRLMILCFLLLSCQKENEKNTNLSALELSIIKPHNYTTFNENMIFKAELKHNWVEMDSIVNLISVWESDKDGVLSSSKIKNSNNITFGLIDLSLGKHKITLTLKNANSDVLKDSVYIYNTFELTKAISSKKNVMLEWSPVDDPNFESYQIFKSFSDDGYNLQYVETILDSKQTSFTVEDSEIGVDFYYWVKVKFSDFDEGFLSNCKKAKIGESMKLDFTIKKIISDPNRGMVYAIVEKTNKPNLTDYGLAFIDVEKQLLVKHILKNQRFRDFEMSEDGQFLYLNTLGNKIYVVNLQSQSFEKTLNVGHIVDNIALGYNDKLFIFIHYLSIQEGFRMYDLSTESLVSFQTTMNQSQQSMSNGNFVVDEDNTIYYGEASSGGKIHKITTSGNVFELIDTKNCSIYGNSPMFYKDNAIYWNHYKFDKNFNILGTYIDSNNNEMRVESITPDGNYATAWRYLINNQTQEIIKKLPVFSDFGVFMDNKNLLMIKNENPLSDEYYSILSFYQFK